MQEAGCSGQLLNVLHLETKFTCAGSAEFDGLSLISAHT